MTDQPNACHFAAGEVRIGAAWDASQISLTIADDGPGFPSELMARLGDPYLTSRPRIVGPGGETQGLGLGIFIAKTLLERTGAAIAFDNAGPGGHAVVRIVWPRQTVVAGGLVL